jgi:cell division control protein 6
MPFCLVSQLTNRLIILDEIDSLLPPSPALPPAATSHLLSKLFSLPLVSSSTRSIKLVAISNTLDLTIRARLSLADNLTPRVLPFKAYGAAEMGDIMLSRIASASTGRLDEETVKVDTKAVELLCRKVEASNGDLRNCLGCLTSAVSLAEAEWTKKLATIPTQVLIKVSLPHTIKAFNSHTQQLKAAAGSNNTSTSSATGKKVRSVPLQGKMVLVSILVYIARTRAGLPGIPTSSSPASTPSPHNTPTKSSDSLNTASLFATYTNLLSHHTSPFPPSHESDYRDLLTNLEVLGLVRLITSASSSKKYGPKVELCAREEEVKEGLGLSPTPTGAGVEAKKGMADDEVKRIYEREGVKIQAAVKKAERASSNVDVLGEEA